jgi:IclR family KDG regulon transcriptional repressor
MLGKHDGQDRDSRYLKATSSRAGWQSNSVRRALAILELLNSSPKPLNSTEISRNLSLPKSTASVLLSTLETAGYVVRDQDGRHYSQSLKAYGSGLTLLSHLDLSRRALPVLRSIAASVNVTAHVAVLDGDQALFVNKVDGAGQPCCDIYPGRKTNIQCTAVGKILLAWMEEEAQREFLTRRRLIRHTNRTVTSAEELSATIDRVKKLGYAWDDQEEELFVRCLAVPIFTSGNSHVSALGITGTAAELRPDNLKFLAGYLKQMSKQIAA